MPSNPQIPREVAEAKGKGAGRVAALGLSLAVIGLVAVLMLISVASNSSGSNSQTQAAPVTGPVEPAVANQQGSYPICSDAKDVFFDPDHCVRLVTVPMRQQCWSGWISTPLDWGWEGETHPDRPLDVLFLDGSRVYVPDGTNPTFNDKRGVFRVRGDGVFTIRILNGPMEREQKRNYEAALQSGRPPEPVYRNFGDALAGRPYVDPCGQTSNAAMIASTSTSAATAASSSSSYQNPIHEEIVTIVATNFLENFMTVQNENGERNINPHNNPLYVKAPNGSWQYSMWWHLEAGDKIRLVWNGDELQRMELFENVRDKKHDEQQNPTPPKTTPTKPAPQVPQMMLAEVLEINALENFIVVQTDQGRQEIHPHNAPLYVKAANGSWQIAFMSSLEAGDKVRLVWREEDPSLLRRIELVENVRTATRR
jgi:type II secretory pathway pseudopilin PulG